MTLQLIEYSVRLNAKKCKEMVENFKGNPNTLMRPAVYGKPNCKKNYHHINCLK